MRLQKGSITCNCLIIKKEVEIDEFPNSFAYANVTLILKPGKDTRKV